MFLEQFCHESCSASGDRGAARGTTLTLGAAAASGRPRILAEVVLVDEPSDNESDINLGCC